jgi:hypothetical protein
MMDVEPTSKGTTDLLAANATKKRRTVGDELASWVDSNDGRGKKLRETQRAVFLKLVPDQIDHPVVRVHIDQ